MKPFSFFAFLPVEYHAHGGSRLGGDKGLPEDPGQDRGQGPVQAVRSGPAQHLHIPLGPACLVVKRLQGPQLKHLVVKRLQGPQLKHLVVKRLQGPQLRHLHNVDMRFHCPQTFLSVDLQCRDDVSELKKTFWD